MEATAKAITPDEVLFSNVTAVRDQDGRVHVYVNQDKMLGAVNVQIGAMESGIGVLSLAIPLSRVRFAEREPKAPVIESKVGNVVQGSFAKFREIQAASDSTTVVPPA